MLNVSNMCCMFAADGNLQKRQVFRDEIVEKSVYALEEGVRGKKEAVEGGDVALQFVS